MNRRRADDQPRDPRDGPTTRFGERSGSGANEPPRGERKERADDWRPRQGPEAREDRGASERTSPEGGSPGRSR